MRPSLGTQPGQIACIPEYIDDVAARVTRETDGAEIALIKPEWTAGIDRKMNQWHTVYAVGGPLVTAQGREIHTDIQKGDRVAVSRCGVDLTLDGGDVKLTLYVVPFEAVLGVYEWECEKCLWRSRREVAECPTCASRIVMPTIGDVARLTSTSTIR